MNRISTQNVVFNNIVETLRRFCAYQERSEQDVRLRAIRLNVTPGIMNKVLTVLKEEGFLDEERFVKGYISGKLQHNQWGKIKIREQLRVKKIQSSLIDNQLNLVDNEQYISVLKQLITKKEVNLQAADPIDKMNRLLRFALSRGFEYDLIMKVLKERNDQ